MHFQLIKYSPAWFWVKIFSDQRRSNDHFYDDDLAAPPIDKRLNIPGRIPLTRPTSPTSPGRQIRNQGFLPQISNKSSTDYSQRCRSDVHFSCHLLRLPLEIRVQIWEVVLEEHTFHLYLIGKHHRAKGPRHLSGRICESLNPNICGLPQGSINCRSTLSAEAMAEEKRKRKARLSILRACRQIYAETIHLLYSSSRFIVSNINLIELLPSLLPSQRLNAIRHLRFTWHNPSMSSKNWFPGPLRIREDGPEAGRDDAMRARKSRWTTVWRNISNMQTLQHLHVKISLNEYFWRTLSAQEAGDVLQPMRSITKPQVFILTIVWPDIAEEGLDKKAWAGRYDSGEANPWLGLPCTIQHVSHIRELTC